MSKDSLPFDPPPIIYPKETYYKDNYARRLSRMDREARLMAKAVRRSTDQPKPKYRDTKAFVISPKEESPPHTVDHLPKEWR